MFYRSVSSICLNKTEQDTNTSLGLPGNKDSITGSRLDPKPGVLRRQKPVQVTGTLILALSHANSTNDHAQCHRIMAQRQIETKFGVQIQGLTDDRSALLRAELTT